MPTTYKTASLYGGAITVDVPSNFADASAIRQIPDNQEVYLAANGYTSIIFDILERVDKPTDAEALQYHFEDLVDGTKDRTDVLGKSESARMRGAGMSAHPLQTLHLIQTPLSPHPNPHQKSAKFTSIHLLLLRLEKEETDIVITVNAPHYHGEYPEPPAGKNAHETELVKEAERIAEKIVETFSVKDWHLFGGGSKD